MDPVLSHGEGAVHPMELVVEAAGVADGLAFVVPPPEGGGRGAAVGATQAQAPRRGLKHRTLKFIILV